MTTSPQPSPDFRPNPERGIFLTGEIGQSTLDLLTPTILRLQNDNRSPISLYIDSRGGSVDHAVVLHRLLTSKDQDGTNQCRLITIATSTAASAAADLLMAGDYALAYPNARILCHGVRQNGDTETLTHEKAIDLAKDLANSNERFAIQLADNCIFRFIFRVAVLASEFRDIRERENNPQLPHTQCFIEALRSRIPGELIEVLEIALKRSEENDALDTYTTRALTQQGEEIGPMPRIRFQSLLLKAILDYEAEKHANDPNWSFLNSGFERIEDKFALLVDKYHQHHADTTNLLCDRWGDQFLTPEQEAAILPLQEPERALRIREAVSNIFRTLWFFFVSICRLLQKDDYLMSAEQAYWLGLIDEVIGRTDLPCLRIFVEYPPSANGDAIAEQQPIAEQQEPVS